MKRFNSIHNHPDFRGKHIVMMSHIMESTINSIFYKRLKRNYSWDYEMPISIEDRSLSFEVFDDIYEYSCVLPKGIRLKVNSWMTKKEFLLEIRNAVDESLWAIN